jgi:GST-like protein
MDMYRLHYWPTPNGHKVTLLLEELGVPYEIVPVNIRTGAQFEPEFLKISPNNRMPALEDLDDGVHLFESGAILLYLADKHGQFIPTASHAQGRAEVLQWLFWQMAGLGPMMGQASHFRNYAPEKVPYAIERYTNESLRLLAVMDKRLADRAFLAGVDYSIADMACYPWASIGARLLAGEVQFPNLDRWVAAIAERPATGRAYALAERPEVQNVEMTDAQKAALFHQGAGTVKRG